MQYIGVLVVSAPHWLCCLVRTGVTVRAFAAEGLPSKILVLAVRAGLWSLLWVWALVALWTVRAVHLARKLLVLAWGARVGLIRQGSHCRFELALVACGADCASGLACQGIVAC